MSIIEEKSLEILKNIPLSTGLMWEKIALFEKQFSEATKTVQHKAGTPQSEEMKNIFPLKQHIEGGLYTREIFMPKGSLVVSMIHKQQHPSFLLKGELSYLTDEGKVIKIKAPHKIFTQTGTQRVLYMHEDCKWCCVYKTDARTFEEAEADVYTNNYKELPKELIEKNKKLWQDYQQEQ
tara:strand:- start:38 stop:574 length:537 start_codon:yes stop_codon:yes gene_type:complete